MRRAVIDVGTNSVKLLVADVAGREVVPLLEVSEQTRLGQGFYETHELQPDAIAQTARAVAAFAAQAEELKPVSIRVIATSAARDAVNRVELLAAIHHASGLETEVITGEQEADWAFKGVTTDPVLASELLLILDVGGGSTEFILGEGPRQFFRESFKLGSVRLLEQVRPHDPPTEADWERCRAWIGDLVETQIRPALAPALRRCGRERVQFIGTGGTSSILARVQMKLETFDREQIERTRLDHESVRSLRERLWGLTLANRRQLIGLPPNRADVILTGTAIFEIAMAAFDLGSLRVSTRGLRFAAVLDEANHATD